MIQKLRHWATENTKIALPVCAVILLLSLGSIIWQLLPSRSAIPDQAWFYDIKADKIFTASFESIPPIKSQAGNEAVLAHYYTCDKCTEDQRFLAYYEKYPEELKKMFEASGMDMHLLSEDGSDTLISVDAVKWVSMNSREGRKIISKLNNRCSSVPPKVCLP
jgi:hypothetical protein